MTFCTSVWRYVSCICCQYSESPKLAKDLVPSVMLLPAGRGRAEKKQNRTSSDLSGEQLQSSSLPLGGKRTRGSGLSVLLSPLLCPGPALLSVGHMLLSNTPLFPCDINQLASRFTSVNAEFALRQSFFLYTQFTKIENCMIYYVFKETG